jgi:uncharacterized protein (TIGR00299 family) protein
MILAAFIDAGLPLEHLRERLGRLDLSGYEIAAPRMMKQGIAAQGFEVRWEHRHHHRTLADILAMIEGSGLGDGEKAKASAVFQKLAEAEGRVHGVEPDKVHFHEVGAVDSIVDMVGAAVAWEWFGIERAVVSPLPLGSGFVETAHGRLPLPAPATLALLEGAPTYGSGLEVELVTPTGAAVLTVLAGEFGPRPAMTIEKTGYGAGRRNLPDRPNVIRLTIGESAEPASVEKLVVGETNIDDMNPEIFPFVMDLLLSAGALDVWLTPVLMKKGRPGEILSFLSRPADVQNLTDIMLTQTTTLGVRTYEVNRNTLPREILSLETPWGEARVKAINRFGRKEIAPEFESCREIAQKTGRPIREIYEEIKKLAG